MADRRLDVFCFGEKVGELQDDRGLRFAYDEEWVAAHRPPASHSLPLHGGWQQDAPSAFFGGLLPEGTPRRQLNRLLQVSAGNDFELLALLGGDCAGAVSILPHGAQPDPPGDGADVVWLSPQQLADQLAELPARPLRFDPRGEARLSLAGAQDKLPVVVDDDGRIGVTGGRTPSTHIIKTPIAHLPGTVANEAFCLRFARELGLSAVAAEPRLDAGGVPFLLVERYDRDVAHPSLVPTRVHQEDVCQALGITADRKYEKEGGPSLADCVSLVRAVGAQQPGRLVPALEIPKLLDAWILNVLVGNHDAHGKNFSLIYRPERFSLAPLYDVLDTAVYPNLSRKLAMQVGGEYRPAYVRTRHLARMIDACGLSQAGARRRIAHLIRRSAEASRAARSALPAPFDEDPIVDRILETVAERTALLSRLAEG